MITIRDIRDRSCSLYIKEALYIGQIHTMLELYDILVQIKHERSSEYYIMFNGNKIRIDRNGSLEEWPIGFFDTFSNLAMQLI